MVQPIATMIPPNATMIIDPRRAPNRSTIQPSIGVSQVSRAIKILKATWTAAMDQPCLAAMGLTKSVQPYCRLAIIIMQRMPQARIIHRVVSVAAGRPSTSIAIDIGPSTVLRYCVSMVAASLTEPIFLNSRATAARETREREAVGSRRGSFVAEAMSANGAAPGGHPGPTHHHNG